MLVSNHQPRTGPRGSGINSAVIGHTRQGASMLDMKFDRLEFGRHVYLHSAGSRSVNAPVGWLIRIASSLVIVIGSRAMYIGGR